MLVHSKYMGSLSCTRIRFIMGYNLDRDLPIRKQPYVSAEQMFRRAPGPILNSLSPRRACSQASAGFHSGVSMGNWQPEKILPGNLQ